MLSSLLQKNPHCLILLVTPDMLIMSKNTYQTQEIHKLTNQQQQLAHEFILPKSINIIQLPRANYVMWGDEK